MTMKVKSWAALLGIGVACAACCAPLWSAVLAALTAASLWRWESALGVLLLVAALVAWRLRRASNRPSSAAPAGCGCKHTCPPR